MALGASIEFQWYPFQSFVAEAGATEPRHEALWLQGGGLDASRAASAEPGA